MISQSLEVGAAGSASSVTPVHEGRLRWVKATSFLLMVR